MDPGRLGLNELPTKSIRPCGAEARAGGPGAECSTGRGCVDVDDSEDEARRRAGGPGRGWRTGPQSSVRTGRGVLTVRRMAELLRRVASGLSLMSGGHKCGMC